MTDATFLGLCGNRERYIDGILEVGEGFGRRRGKIRAIVLIPQGSLQIVVFNTVRFTGDVWVPLPSARNSYLQGMPCDMSIKDDGRAFLCGRGERLVLYPKGMLDASFLIAA